METVDGVGGDVQRGVKTERNFRGREVVVNRLGHSHHGDAHASEVPRDRQCAIAANHDQCVQAQFLHVPATRQGIVVCYLLAILFDRIVKRISPVRGAQNRAAAGENSRDRLDGERNCAFRPDQSVEAVMDANNAPPVSQDYRTDSAANDGVQTRAVPAPVGDADRLYGGIHASSVLRQATGPSAQDDILH